MATIQLKASVTIVDEWGTEASTAMYAQASDTHTLASLDAEIADWITAIDAVTGGYIKAARVEIIPALPGGVKTAGQVVAGSRVEQNGGFGFEVSGTSKKYTTYIPALLDDSTVLNGDRIVLTSTQPAGVLIAILTTVGTVLTWLSEHNQQITGFIDAFVAFHKKRKQLQRSSYEV